MPARRTLGRASAAQVAAARHRIYERDGHRCVAEGARIMCDGPLTIQHRIGRGMGSSAKLDHPSLLLTMCFAHNLRIESDAEMRKLAIANGWSASRFTAAHPSSTIRYPGGRWFVLDDDFGRREVWP